MTENITGGTEDISQVKDMTLNGEKFEQDMKKTTLFAKSA